MSHTPRSSVHFAVRPARIVHEDVCYFSFDWFYFVFCLSVLVFTPCFLPPFFVFVPVTLIIPYPGCIPCSLVSVTYVSCGHSKSTFRLLGLRVRVVPWRRLSCLRGLIFMCVLSFLRGFPTLLALTSFLLLLFWFLVFEHSWTSLRFPTWSARVIYLCS